MIKSMTGFGKATVENKGKKIVIEIKSLNSKQLDINLRTSNLYKEKDIEMRSMVKNYLERGKIDMCVYLDSEDSEKEVRINQAVIEQYYKQMLDTADHLGIQINSNELLQTIMRFPDTLKQSQEELDEEEWEVIKTGIKNALEAVDAFRVQEGKVLIEDILYRVNLIKQLANEVTPFEKKRTEQVREKLMEKLKEWNDVQSIDKNRMEQEIIYYLEKLDITEEKIRLENHCHYFIETVENEDSVGRKLGFIAQEIGREINTMGSKANDHNIQKLVVRMKDELEKIKEQSLNIL